ncbi:MAG: pyridine nucleotide-disulfide oxidoreductase [Micrococcaceae bacterium]|jgi:sulfide:quinone oxidoreductase|nr:pyridine nucleotide-disulfide oxidoreductase [Micrococcaceae bacterium]
MGIRQRLLRSSRHDRAAIWANEPVGGEERHEVVILGGGNAGVSLAGRLARYGIRDVTVVEPKERHLYQPFFSHIAGGTADPALAVRAQAEVMPDGVLWIRDAAVDVQPGRKVVVLASGRRVRYGQLVVCPGLRLDWDAVPGLAEAIQTPDVASNYDFDLAQKAWPLLRDLRQGTAIFTSPSGPVTCGGAAQKPMYLACDHWRQQGVLANIRVVLVVPTPTVYGAPIVDEELNRKIAEYGIELLTESELTAVRAAEHSITVHNRATGHNEELTYDVLHVVPPQSARDWLKETDLPAIGDASGFVEVDPETLQHRRYPSVWSLGDSAATRNSKSGAALRKQTTVLAKNLRAVLRDRTPTSRYDSYSACPFTVSRSTVVFAEFDDRYQPKPSLPWKGLAREHRATWVLERNVLPWVYWNLILKGRA